MIPMPVFDLENKLTKRQIDSLSILAEQVNEEKDVHLYIVTIDEFYPDLTGLLKSLQRILGTTN